MLALLDELVALAREALAARGNTQRLAEMEQEVVALRREINALKDYRDAREVDDEAQRILGG